MEVHHPHHPNHKKNWKEYITEFLMLFFAVTLGFLAENSREHYVEKQREIELAKSLYNEMKTDSINLEKVIAFRIKKESYLDYMYRNYNGDVDNDSLQKIFQVADYIGVASNSQTIFEPRNAIVSQLLSSGMMRYFKDEVIQNDLHDIINIAEQVKVRMEREFEIYQNFILPVSIKYRNMDFERDITLNDNSGKSVSNLLEDYLKSDKYYKYPKNNISKEDLIDLHKKFEMYRLAISAGRKSQLQQYSKINKLLLSDLRKYYNL